MGEVDGVRLHVRRGVTVELNRLQTLLEDADDVKEKLGNLGYPAEFYERYKDRLHADPDNETPE